jgi:hypothetical protein
MKPQALAAPSENATIANDIVSNRDAVYFE